MDYLDSFGEWLRQRREALRLTRPELAECAGCSVSALRKIEADERRPSRQLAELLAGCLHIGPEEQPTFIDAARGARRVARLGRPAPRAALPPSTSVADSTLPAAADWNLPAPATRLVGREAELAALAQLLDDPTCRLLSLVGPGGIGKTRLAIEAACDLWQRFADGVFFASLAGTSSSEFMVPAIAQAVALNFAGPADPRVQLANYLRNKQVLLLLDNLEHLLEGVDLLVEMLEETPGVKLLVTSRERLELQAEWVFEVQGLPVPAEDEVERLEKYSAVQLFLQRTRQAQVAFELSTEDRAHVARICRLVEGMPLAIELAAAWVPVLSCAEIADEIARSIDFLTTTMRDVPERQRSIRAVFDHSWHLLSEEEQQVLRPMSIFRGGFTRQAAEAVAGAGLPLLSALLAKSFLRRTSADRYSLHELVRQYVAGRLAAVPEEEVDARDRHSAYYADFVAWLEGELKGAGQLQALAMLDAEIDNIRAGWQRAMEQGEEEAFAPYVDGMMHFYEIRGWHEEALQLCERAIGVLKTGKSEDAQRLALKIRVHQAGALQHLDRLKQAEQLLEASLSTAQTLDSKEDIAHVLLKLGEGAMFSGLRAAADDALQYFEQALEIYEAVDDHYGKVKAIQNMAWTAVNLQQLDLAQQLHRRNLPLLRRHGPQSLLAWTLYEIGAMECERGAYEEARRYLEEARSLCEEIDYHFALLSCLLALGQTAERVGQFRQGQSYYEQAVALRPSLGDLSDIATSLTLLTRVTLELEDMPRAEGFVEQLRAFCEKSRKPTLRGCYHCACGELELTLGRLAAAEAHFHESVAILQPTRRPAIALLSLFGLAKISSRRGDDEQAVAYFRAGLHDALKRSSVGPALEATIGIGQILARQESGEQGIELAALVQTHPATPWKARRQADKLLAELREVLPEERLAAAIERGRARSLETVATKLLGDESI